jgi:hypothetical protein
MSENVVLSHISAASVCEQAVESYRQAGKTIQAPAIRKVIESIIGQKTEHVKALRSLEGRFSCEAAALNMPAAIGPEEILQSIVSHELSFAASLDALSASIAADEPKMAIKAIADGSRKFASWTKDHLDLLAMF